MSARRSNATITPIIIGSMLVLDDSSVVIAEIFKYNR
jgi:hypothetical protein